MGILYRISRGFTRFCVECGYFLPKTTQIVGKNYTPTQNPTSVWAKLHKNLHTARKNPRSVCKKPTKTHTTHTAWRKNPHKYTQMWGKCPQNPHRPTQCGENTHTKPTHTPQKLHSVGV